ncbi:MAG: hypothetical protein ACLGH5_06790 [Actinomycetes bacterium]
MTNATETYPPNTPPPYVAGPPTKNTIGLVALILAVVGALMAIVPATNGFSWLILLAALVLAIIGLTRKGQKKGTSIAALILSVVFWLISVVVGIGVIAAGVSESIESPPVASEPDSAPATEPDPDEGSEPAEEPAADVAGVGDSVTTDSGVAVTLASIENGVLPPNDFIVSEVRGTLVAVTMSMTNGSSDSVAISTSSVFGYIGDAEYEAAAVFGADSGEWYVYEEINPGLTANFIAYFDVPADSALDTVKFQTALLFGEEASFVTQ